MTKEKRLIIYIFTIAVWCYTAFLLYRILGAVIQTADYPNEYREAANVAMTQSILRGINIYDPVHALGEVPTVCYLYGPLMSLLAALIKVLLPGCSIWAIHYGISFVSMIASAYMLGLMVYSERKNILPASVAFMLGIICHWRYGYIYAAPDSLGLCLMILVLFILSGCEKKEKSIFFAPELAAFFAVLTFFTKQYFVIVAVAGALYLLFLSKRLFVRYAAAGIVISAIAFAIVSCIAPLYWTYALYFLKGPGPGAAMGKTGIAYNTMQVSYLGGMLLTLFVSVLGFTVFAIYKIVKGQKISFDIKHFDEPLIAFREGSVDFRFYALFYSQMLLSALLLKYIGNNDGAFLSYYLQLFVPPLLVVAVCAADSLNISGRAGVICFAAAYLVFVGYTIYKIEPRLIINQLSDEEIANWEQAYDIAGRYSEGGVDKVYYTPPMNYLGYEMQQHIYNDGQPFVFTEKFLKAYENSAAAQSLYPHAGEIISQHLKYREGMKQRVIAGDYELVMYIDGQDPVFTREELEQKYEQLEVIPLRTGNWAWDVEFWVKNS